MSGEPAGARARLREVKAIRWLWVASKQLAHVGTNRWFVGRARDESDRRIRRTLLRAFGRIHRGVWCAHDERELLLMADWLLNHRPEEIPGVMVECGCFRGGSSAKLSLIAAETGRRLLICDSFEGLPEPGRDDRRHMMTSGVAVEYDAGDYSARGLQAVRGAIARYGAVEVCEFVQGYFERTLPIVQADPAFVFIDVDYIESARTCLLALWPRLAPGGRFFTHEASVRDYVLGITDRSWWQSSLRELPPVLFGAGFGMGPGAPQVAYFEKPAETPIATRR